MKVFIPCIGSSLTLAKPWTFDLYALDQNKSIFAAALLKYIQLHGKPVSSLPIYWNTRTSDFTYKGKRIDNPVETITLPVGAILTVSRISIRRGAAEHNLLSFYLLKHSCAFFSTGAGTIEHFDPKVRSLRFSAKLQDVNAIEAL